MTTSQSTSRTKTLAPDGEKLKLHFLLNISSDTENLFGVRFFSSFFKNGDECDITLFHISRLDSKDSSESLMEVWKGPGETAADQLARSAQKALSRACRNLQSNSVTISKMKTKTVQERFGKVKDILNEGAEGLYDAIVLGRRATYALQWLFGRPGDEIPQAIIQDASLSCPLWICAEPEEGRKNILLCVDGSESSMRAADHVGYILSRTPEHQITVFHVATTPDEKSQGIIDKAINILRSHEIEGGRIKEKTSRGLSVTGAILAEKNSGRYAAIAIGLEGNREGGLLSRIGMNGKTAATLVNKISKAALWICP
jgi:hypothetical protein